MEDCELPNQSVFEAWLEHKRGGASRFRIRLARHLAMSGDAAPENTTIKGDWNGAGMHTSFSTLQTRAEGGASTISSAVVQCQMLMNR